VEVPERSLEGLLLVAAHRVLHLLERAAQRRHVRARVDPHHAQSLLERGHLLEEEHRVGRLLLAVAAGGVALLRLLCEQA